MWRHGDVLIGTVEAIPGEAKKQQSLILVRGEMTGHSHRIADPGTAEVFEFGDLLFVEVIAESATIIHEEHQPIILPQGFYRVWVQREYSPREIRRVID